MLHRCSYEILVLRKFICPEECLGCRDGAVVRAFTSHQCGPDRFPDWASYVGMSLLLVLVLGSPVFPWCHILGDPGAENRVERIFVGHKFLQ